MLLNEGHGSSGLLRIAAAAPGLTGQGRMGESKLVGGAVHASRSEPGVHSFRYQKLL